MRSVPPDNLAYPVLINFLTGRKSSGSGFVLKTDKKFYLITAKHVLVDLSDNSVHGELAEIIMQTALIDDDSKYKLLVNLKRGVLLKHENADVAAIELFNIVSNVDGTERLEPARGILIKERGETPFVNVDARNSTKLLSEVFVANDVLLYGYPTSLGLRDSPRFDFEKPLLRKGIVANIYKPESAIILDCPSYYGNSGGPVVEVEQENLTFTYKIIGIVTEFIPFFETWINPQSRLKNIQMSNSGYSVAVSMDKVFELIGYNKR